MRGSTMAVLLFGTFLLQWCAVGSTAPGSTCPCPVASYCKYDMHNESRIWPYPGVCYNSTTPCDCISCPDNDKTKYNPCRNRTTTTPATTTKRPKTTTTGAVRTTTSVPTPTPFAYAPDCMAFYDQHSNDSFPAFLRWNGGLFSISTQWSRSLAALWGFNLDSPTAVQSVVATTTSNASNDTKWPPWPPWHRKTTAPVTTPFPTTVPATSLPATTHRDTTAWQTTAPITTAVSTSGPPTSAAVTSAAVATTPAHNGTTATPTTGTPYPAPSLPFPTLPMRVFADGLMSVLLVASVVLTILVDVALRAATRSCGSSCAFFSMPTALVAVTCCLGLVLTVPSMLLFYVTALPMTATEFTATAISPPRNLLQQFVEDYLAIPLHERHSGANATTPNIACALLFEPLNPWAVVCLVLQWMYVLLIL